ncbi:hypothetical protein K9W35_004947 [Salmonella enterica subsp. enterica serovar Teshie]|nr:hypothetical protein [Salmonella enterica subsp. enterica serovar Teshie]EIB9850799.1 hypothetical protein [Salmonella enterica subsp. enterica serovar Teshie]EIB9860652.1 hypothetical protein [Salmonella enterica subsp. enterica serovar Teshie]
MNAPVASYPILSDKTTGCQAPALPPESAVTECLLATCPGDSKNYASRRDYAAFTVLAPPGSTARVETNVTGHQQAREQNIEKFACSVHLTSYATAGM